MRIALRSILVVVFWITACPAVHAGAWTQPAGNGLLIITGDYYAADHFWNNQGNKQTQATYSKEEISPYLEYGLTDSITLGANLSLQHAHQGSPGESNWGLGDSEFFLRKRLWQSGGFVLSAEPMVKLPSPESSASLPQLGGSHPDAGLGFSGGYGFNAWGEHHYADLDTQYRYRFGQPKNQINLAGTIGIGLTPRWVIMPQAFLTLRTSSPSVAAFTQSPADDYNLLKLQLSALYKINNTVSLQFGGFRDVWGKNVGQGNGVLIALWKNF